MERCVHVPCYIIFDVSPGSDVTDAKQGSCANHNIGQPISPEGTSYQEVYYLAHTPMLP